jgi:hypothetical protein
MADAPPFPFVLGCGRSGTTLVRAVLDAHPDIAVPDESYFPVWFGRRRFRYGPPGAFDTPAFVEDLLAHESSRRWGLDPDMVRRELIAMRPATFADAVRGYYGLYAAERGKARFADKTPIFALHIPLLAELFPEAVFVHVVRDGRAVVLSRLEASWGSHRFEHETLQWRAHSERARADGLALAPNRYHEIRYEELLDDPERVTRALCEFVQVDYDPTMLRYHERARPLVEALPHPEEHRNLLRPPTKGLRDWRTELSPDRIRLFESLAGPTLDLFGYERISPGAAPVAVRARAIQARARYAGATRYRSARSALWRAVHRNGAS